MKVGQRNWVRFLRHYNSFSLKEEIPSFFKRLLVLQCCNGKTFNEKSKANKGQSVIKRYFEPIIQFLLCNKTTELEVNKIKSYP